MDENARSRLTRYKRFLWYIADFLCNELLLNFPRYPFCMEVLESCVNTVRIVWKTIDKLRNKETENLVQCEADYSQNSQ